MNVKQMNLMAKQAFLCKRPIVRMVILSASLLFCSQASAYDGLSSELPHAAGGVALAGGITFLADKYTEHKSQRAWIGFGLSTLFFTIVEMSSGNTPGNRLDIASDVIGSAVGAFATDKWLLKPVIKRENMASSYVGVETTLTF